MTIRAGWTLLLAICVAITLIAVAPVPGLAGPKALYDNPIEPQMTPKLNLGKLNYQAYCAACHGQTAAGSDKGPTFVNRIYHPGHHGDRAFFIAPRKGVQAHHWSFGDMKPVPGVTDNQLSSIIEYVRAIQKANGIF